MATTDNTKDILKEKLDTLHSIARELSDSNKPLDYLIDRYEEGITLAQETKQMIAELEGRIITIQQTNDIHLTKKGTTK